MVWFRKMPWFREISRDLYEKCQRQPGWRRALRELRRARELQPQLRLEVLVPVLLNHHPHGHFAHWLAAIDALAVAPRRCQWGDIPAVQGSVDREALRALLLQLKPWRKGHFHLFGEDLDGEWRSEWKYQRLLNLGVAIRGRRILDVGCGNGYYLFRLLADGARSVIGLDPSWPYLAQYLLLRKLFTVPHWLFGARPPRSAYLPLTLDAGGITGFDLTLSMGVLYHRREPLEHLRQLHATLKPGGELLLETLIWPGGPDHEEALPQGYAGMRNIYSLPTTARLCQWLAAAGFTPKRFGPAVVTTPAEQRRTAWLDSHSLADFLNPSATATREGLPLPTRQMILAQRT